MGRSGSQSKRAGEKGGGARKSRRHLTATHCYLLPDASDMIDSNGYSPRLCNPACLLPYISLGASQKAIFDESAPSVAA